MESANSDCDYFNESFQWSDFNQWSHVRKANMGKILIQFSPLRCPTFLPVFAHLRAPIQLDPSYQMDQMPITVAFESLFLLSLLTHGHLHQHPTLPKSLPCSFHLLRHRGYRAIQETLACQQAGVWTQVCLWVSKSHPMLFTALSGPLP